MEKATLAFIGGGNMATSIIGGLVKDGFNPKNIWVSNPGEEKRLKLQALFDVNVTSDNQVAISQADVVIFAVKPQVLKSVAHDLASSIQSKKPLVISVAAGIRIDDLSRWIGGDMPLVRALPNTPALLGCGATGLFANELATGDQKDLSESIFRSVGLTVWVDAENLLDSLMSISCCGPAYLFLLMESMQKTGEQLGLKPEDAKLLTLQASLGAARMALESEEGLVELRQRITSKGGVTEQAIKTLQEGHLEKLVEKAMSAVIKRSEELSDEYGKEVD